MTINKGAILLTELLMLTMVFHILDYDRSKRQLLWHSIE